MSKVRENMQKIARYQKIVATAYEGDDAERFNNLSREIKLSSAELVAKLNEKLFAELRRDFMTLGVGCISTFEDSFSHIWGDGENEKYLSDEQIDMLNEWNKSRQRIFDRVSDVLHKYQQLLED